MFCLPFYSNKKDESEKEYTNTKRKTRGKGRRSVGLSGHGVLPFL